MIFSPKNRKLLQIPKLNRMYFNKKELTLLYNGERVLDRKTLAMALTLGVKINRQDLTSVRLSETLFMLFLNKLNIEPKALFDKSHPYYQSELRGREYTAPEWYEILLRKPELLRAPLAMYREKAMMCTSPNDMLKMD